MRPSVRLLNREVPSLQATKSLYLCSTCRREVRPRPFITTHQFRRNASESLSFTERMRRKIWGTDKAPGLEDPYGGEGIIERTIRRKLKGKDAEEEEQQQQEALEEVPEEEYLGDIAPPDAYVPATTWDDLERVGHLGRWSDFPPTDGDKYTPFKSRFKFKKTRHVYLAGHQAAVEIALMHKLKKPLTNVCNVTEHHKPIFKWIWRCKFQPTKSDPWEAVAFTDKVSKEALIYVFQQIGDTTPSEPAADAEEITDDSSPRPPAEPFFGIQRVRNDSFLSLPLSDPAIKFAFLKRLSQLTGHFLPDSAIHSFTTVKQVMDYMDGVLNPKPRKLAFQLAADSSVQELPNVKVFKKRQSRCHMDDEVGRKKVIDAELRARGLVIDQ